MDSDPVMKTAEQILAEACRTIAHIHNRPTMYLGSTKRSNAADMFDGIIWVAHWFWASIQNREEEFRQVVSNVHELHQCSSQGFPDAIRRLRPGYDHETVFTTVKECWAEIDSILGIDISEEATGS